MDHIFFTSHLPPVLAVWGHQTTLTRHGCSLFTRSTTRQFAADFGMSRRCISQFCYLLAAAIIASCVISALAAAASLSDDEFAGLAAQCAPTVAARTLRAVASTESDLDPWALHDNTTGVGERSPTFDTALATAQSWIDRGDSVDIGLMQINSANLAALGMTPRTALDACVSLAGGAAVLQAAYGGGNTPADQQVALLLALSRYNTGSPFRGILNGYARHVIASAESGSVRPPSVAPGAPSSAPDAAVTDPDAPPAWNVGAVGSYAQKHGAPWLVALRPPSLNKHALPDRLASAPAPSMVVAANAPSAIAVLTITPIQPKTRSPE